MVNSIRSHLPFKKIKAIIMANTPQTSYGDVELLPSFWSKMNFRRNLSYSLFLLIDAFIVLMTFGKMALTK